MPNKRFDDNSKARAVRWSVSMPVPGLLVITCC